MENRGKEVTLLVLRIALGVIFMAHGAQKLFGWFDGPGLSGAAGFLGQMGFKPPLFWAFALAASEFFGGLGVLVGLLTRLAALSLLIGQIVAVIKVHAPNGFFLSNKGFEYNLSLIAISLALIIVGAGAISLDAGLKSWLAKRKATVEKTAV